jgi:haloacetate dehalogenase
MFEEFEVKYIDAGGVSIFLRMAGSGPPLLLLHGFPQTHLMWRLVAPALARTFTVVCADLPGYGKSGAPPPSPDHALHSKRAMAADLIGVMGALGFGKFMVAGHDRGGRVAYRMALDHPEKISMLAVLDIVPTDIAWDRADDRFALAFWPWSLLAQPEPLPERLILSCPEAMVDNALDAWGSDAEAFPPEVRAAYVDALRDPERAHAICEEYRAAATLDRDHDAADRRSGRRIPCPVLALWSSSGGVASWYSGEGGPLGLWRLWADDTRGHELKGGHFFPEEAPEETIAALSAFFTTRSE